MPSTRRPTTQLRTRRALIILDCQNAFLSPTHPSSTSCGGASKSNGSKSKEPLKKNPMYIPPTEVSRVISNLEPLVLAFREAGDEVIWVSTHFEETKDNKARDGVFVDPPERPVSASIVTANLQAQAASSNAPTKAAQAIKEKKPKNFGRFQGLIEGILNDTDECESEGAKDDTKEEDICDDSSPSDDYLSASFAKKYPTFLKAEGDTDPPPSISTIISAETDKRFTKTNYSAFMIPNFLTILRSRMVTEIYFAGAHSNTSVFASVADAAMHGFVMAVITDCVLYRSIKRHEAAIGEMESELGVSSMTTSGLLKKLGRGLERRESKAKEKGKAKAAGLKGAHADEDDDPKTEGEEVAGTGRIRNPTVDPEVVELLMEKLKVGSGSGSGEDDLDGTGDVRRRNSQNSRTRSSANGSSTNGSSSSRASNRDRDSLQTPGQVVGSRRLPSPSERPRSAPVGAFPIGADGSELPANSSITSQPLTSSISAPTDRLPTLQRPFSMDSPQLEVDDDYVSVDQYKRNVRPRTSGNGASPGPTVNASAIPNPNAAPRERVRAKISFRRPQEKRRGTGESSGSGSPEKRESTSSIKASDLTRSLGSLSLSSSIASGEASQSLAAKEELLKTLARKAEAGSSSGGQTDPSTASAAASISASGGGGGGGSGPAAANVSQSQSNVTPKSAPTEPSGGAPPNKVKDPKVTTTPTSISSTSKNPTTIPEGTLPIRSTSISKSSDLKKPPSSSLSPATMETPVSTSPPAAGPTIPPRVHHHTKKQSRKSQAAALASQTLGADDTIGEPTDTTSLHADILPPSLSATIFQTLKTEVQWRVMYHRGGSVPRLVAVQGVINPDGSFPIYRHPADESPPLLPFSPAVEEIRKHVEGVLKHPVNHVLIQLYRGGEDYISEHSDKTLDIVKGSSIVNVSLGAQRVMTLRTKKKEKEKAILLPKDAATAAGSMTATTPPAEDTSSSKTEPAEAEQRIIQKVPLPHNSMFILGLPTNERWTHSINPDKRPPREKSPDELAYAGERISLTFRHIGTYLSKDENKIWGQGATHKTLEEAGDVIVGEETKAEEMVYAFAAENQSLKFNWDAWYGKGFDVLHFKAQRRRLRVRKEVGTIGGLVGVESFGVRIAMEEIGWGGESVVVEEMGEGLVKGLLESESGIGGIPVLEDMDRDRTVVCGMEAVLMYLAAAADLAAQEGDGEKKRRRGLLPDIVKQRAYYGKCLSGLMSARKLVDAAAILGAMSSPSGIAIEHTLFDPIRKELDFWEKWYDSSKGSLSTTGDGEDGYIDEDGRRGVTIVDCAVYPYVARIKEFGFLDIQRADGRGPRWANLAKWAKGMEKERSVKAVMKAAAAAAGAN